MKSKKSIDLAFTAIAVAAMVLIVIIVSVTIFTTGSQKFAKTTNSCENNGGQCISSTECESTPLNFECQKDKVCCAPKTGFV